MARSLEPRSPKIMKEGTTPSRKKSLRSSKMIQITTGNITETERYINLDYSRLFPGTESQISSTERTVENMRTELKSTPETYDALLPECIPGCRRLTPGPGYRESLVQPNVHITNSPVTNITNDVSLPHTFTHEYQTLHIVGVNYRTQRYLNQK